MRARCQRVRRNPSRPDATRPTYDVRIGYQFPSDRYYHNLDERDVSTVIRMGISFGDVVCEHETRTLAANMKKGVRVCSLEDIVAEKLRALLQQPIRNRNRRQDAYDLAFVVTRAGEKLNRAKVSRFLKVKCTARQIEPRKSAFNDDIRERAEFEYDKYISERTGAEFIPFETAWNHVLELVASLDLPT